MYVYCFKLLHSCSNSTSSAHAKQEHYIWVWQAQAHITQTAPPVLHLTVFTSLPDPYPPWPPGLTFTEGFLWASLTLCSVSVFPTLHRAFEGQFIFWYWLTCHPPTPSSSSSSTSLSSSLHPFNPPAEVSPNQSGFLGIFLRKKRRRARQARSCHSSSELTTRAGLGQINRTKLIIDFNHY